MHAFVFIDYVTLSCVNSKHSHTVSKRGVEDVFLGQDDHPLASHLRLSSDATRCYLTALHHRMHITAVKNRVLQISHVQPVNHNVYTTLKSGSQLASYQHSAATFLSSQARNLSSSLRVAKKLSSTSRRAFCRSAVG